jgi:hypothetical protein
MQLQQLYKADFLLQVWSLDGEVVYEHLLKCNYHFGAILLIIDDIQTLLILK